MLHLKIPHVLVSLASKKGIKIPPTGKVNPKLSLLKVSASLKANGAIHTFVVPPIGISPATALSAGAKILAQGKGADEIISNTRAMAALGDKDSARGLAALMTAQALLAHGKKIPPPPSKVKPMAFKKTYSQAEVNTMAQKKTSLTGNVSVWVKIKRWIGKHI